MWEAGQSPIPGYKLEEFIGKGNFGEVWRAASPGGTKCALKFLNLRERQGRKELRAIQRLKQIRHANLMPLNAMWLLDDQQQIIPDDHLDPSHVFMEETHRQTLVSMPAEDDSENPRTLVIAMPLAEGNLLELLHQRQREGKDIPVSELLVYLMDGARALDYLNSQCHEYGGEIVSVQHGDVKPENLVLLGGSAMLCDFGVARTLGAAADTRGTSLGGSLAYMAPECLAGKVSRNSDQFSLAVSYAELRTGNLPFDDQSMTQVIEDRRKGQLKLEGLLPAEQRVIRRACAVNPEKRFRSNVEMIEALRAAAVGAPPTAKKTGWLATAAVAVMALALSSVAWMFWLPNPSPPDSPPDDSPLPKTAAAWFADAMGVVQQSPLSATGRAEAAELYGRALQAGFPIETPAPRRLGIPDNKSSNIYAVGYLPFISQLVAADSDGGRMLVVDQDGRSLVEFADEREGRGNQDRRIELDLPTPIASVQWLDDTHLLVHDCATTLWRIELPGGGKVELANGVLSATTSRQARIGLAASDHVGASPSGLLLIGPEKMKNAPYPLITPLLALAPTGRWGVVIEELEHPGTAGLLSLETSGDPMTLRVLQRIDTQIEAYCAACFQIADKCFAVVGGKSSEYPTGLALLPFPAGDMTNPPRESAVLYLTPNSASDLFGDSGRVVRSLATQVPPQQTWAWLATGQDISTGNATTELWKVQSDGTAIHQGFLGQETQAESISVLAFDPDGQWLVRGTSLGEVRLTKLDQPQLDFELLNQEYNAEVLQLQIVAGKIVATFDDASVLIWNFNECQMVYDTCRQLKKPLPRPLLTRAHSG